MMQHVKSGSPRRLIPWAHRVSRNFYPSIKPYAILVLPLILTDNQIIATL